MKKDLKWCHFQLPGGLKQRQQPSGQEQETEGLCPKKAFPGGNHQARLQGSGSICPFQLSLGGSGFKSICH